MRLIIITLSLLLWSCASSGVHVSKSEVDQFKIGQTSAQDVLNELGPATTETTELNSSSLTYVYTEMNVRPETFIPYAGAFIGGADTKTNAVTFVFNENEVLKDIKQQRTQLGTKNNINPNYDRVDVKSRSD